MHTWREGVWAPPLARRSTIKRWLSHLYRAVVLGFCLPFSQLSGFFFHTWPALRLSPGCATFSKMDSSTGAYGMALASHIIGWCPLLFTPKECFCTCEMSAFPQGWKIHDVLIFTQAAFSPSVSPMTIILKCPQETKPGYLPHFYCYFFFKVQIVGCKHLTWSPPISCLRKCKQEASCKCLAQNPSISWLTRTFQVEGMIWLLWSAS